jgi:hypothetical protein
MQWTFQRGGLELLVETRRAGRDGRYVLRILWPSGREQFETFPSEGSFRQRLLALEAQLANERWIRASESMLNDVADGKRRAGGRTE